MGFLDNSTNNVILDAVLTDAGRRLLASSGRFTITKFALADDEVDYGIVQQYGRTVGKEKIEKNTPVFEALTNPTIALRHSLTSISTVSNTITYLPTLTLSPSGVVQLDFSSKSSKVISVELSIESGFSCPPELIDDDFYVNVDNRFLRASSNSVTAPNSISSTSIATYTFPSDSTASTNPLSRLSFSLTPQSVPAATQSAYKVPGTTYVTTYVSIIGRNSGQRSDIQVNITTSV
jgi:hypothetical protein